MADYDHSTVLPVFAPAGRPGADPEQNPVVAAVLLGATLLARRLDLGLKQYEAAKQAAMSASRLCKLERGDALPQRRDIEILADLYKILPCERNWLQTLTKLAHQPAQWKREGLTISIPSLSQLVGLEPAAERLWTYEAKLISGLLQTEAYMRALMLSTQPPLERGEIEERVQLRLYRQRKLADNFPECVVILDESMLYRRIGDHKTMAGQLDRLIEVEGNPRVQIRIVPLDGNQVLTGVNSLTQLEFDRGATKLPSMIYLETTEKGKYFVKGDEPKEKGKPSFEGLSTTMTMLLKETADRNESLKMVKQARQRFTR
ncbi:helix-turn-helix transcriptional regulator [Kitasatospora xanthocidica]|uniref:helix-turn-helix domain-containing protein n=1 Tax=Kitasatospora xanthocidica TaxID=83382 RepID=UPI0015F33369|nr:helix-turn-helix transcriptional regulator [Kitasatospora xanthocidica]